MKDHLRLTVSTYTPSDAGVRPVGIKLSSSDGFYALSFGRRRRWAVRVTLETARAARLAIQRRARQRHSAITSVFLNGPATPEEIEHAVDCVSPRAHRGLR